MYTKCSIVASKVSEIVDHEASFLTKVRFYGHLMMCSKCREYFQLFRTVNEAAGMADPDELPNDFDHVMDFVMEKIERKDNN